MITRRELLFAAAFALLPGRANTSGALLKSEQLNQNSDAAISWAEFQLRMAGLAESNANGRINQQAMVEHGMLYLKQLNIDSAEFKQAIDAAYESGNRYWLWQRLMNNTNINGGILNINSDKLVELHDHPGATGMVRIISGETEVWQFDEVSARKESKSENAGEQGDVELVRVAHRILKPGDMALLTPEKGNIHALRAVSDECSMLDFFIPPYIRRQRSWYQPLDKNWFDKEKVACRKIPQDKFSMI